MSDADDDKKVAAAARAKLVKRAVLVGFILAAICNTLPHQYRAVCHTIANACSGGIL